MSNVTWRPHPVVSALEASSDGLVRVTDRVVTDPRGGKYVFPGRVLKAHPNDRGYLRINISRGGHRINLSVHRVVCEAFHGVKPSQDSQVRHLNGDLLDNRPENLRWGTAQENAGDRLVHGTNPNASKTHCKRGHQFTPENTYQRPGGRTCRECKREYERRRYQDKGKRGVTHQVRVEPVGSYRWRGVCSCHWHSLPDRRERAVISVLEHQYHTGE